jgi:hypothetical protein
MGEGDCSLQEVADCDVQFGGDLCETSDRNPVLPLFVLLELLERDAELFGKSGLGEPAFAADASSRACR